MRLIPCLGLVLLLGGCASIAEGGPTGDAILSQRSAVLPYSLVPVTAGVVEVLTRSEPNKLAGQFPDKKRPPAVIKLGIGDVVSISLYESAVGGLLVPGDSGARPGNYVDLPHQAIDNRGNISFPYGGLIKAAGLTTSQLQNIIIERIKNRAIEPQVIVSVLSQETSLVSVQGEVRNPLRYPAAYSGAGDRVSDAITRAGGPVGQGFETWLVLERDGKRATIPFETLLADPTNDIHVQPGDRIFVYREPQKIIVFGATGTQAEIPFDTWRLNLAAAVGKAGGLLDTRANAGSVFLYRREPALVATHLGVPPSDPIVEVVPIIFAIDLSDPAGFFLATKLMMRNGDLLFVANSKSVEVTKAIGFFNTAISTAVNASTAALVVNSALVGSSSTGLTTIGGLNVVPSGVTGQPGTITPAGIGNGVSPTMSPTGGTSDEAKTSTATAGSSSPGSRPAATTNAAITTMMSPRIPTPSPNN